MEWSRLVTALGAQVDVLVVDHRPGGIPGDAAASARGLTFARVRTAGEARDRLASSPPRVLIAPIELPGRGALDLLWLIDAMGLETEVALLCPSLAGDLRRGAPGRLSLITESDAPEYLTAAADRLARRARNGGLARFGLAEYLSAGCAMPGGVELRFRRLDGRLARLEVHEGAIFGVAVGDLEGEAALALLDSEDIVRDFRASALARPTRPRNDRARRLLAPRFGGTDRREAGRGAQRDRPGKDG